MRRTRTPEVFRPFNTVPILHNKQVLGRRRTQQNPRMLRLHGATRSASTTSNRLERPPVLTRREAPPPILCVGKRKTFRLDCSAMS